MKKTPFLALALSGLVFVGCTDEEAQTADPILDEAEVVTAPEDDLAVDDSLLMGEPTMADSTMADSTMTEGEMRDSPSM